MLTALLMLALAQAPLDTPDVQIPLLVDTNVTSIAQPVHTVVDTPTVRPRPRAIEYDDQYYTRLTIHRYGSYAMLPLFAGEYALGQNLINDASPPSWMKPAHTGVALGLGALFAVNTVTGAWNLWESRSDPSNRALRITHTLLMLASDAGFAITGALTPENHSSNFSDIQSSRNRHRNWAIGSMGVATVGTALMWSWKQ